MFRVGTGQDSHRFTSKKKPLVVGGVIHAPSGGLEGNSDADVVLHSLCNALSSAIGGDSLSTWSDEMQKKGILDSQKYVEYIFGKLKKENYKIENVSFTVEAKKPYFRKEAIGRMKKNVARLLEIEVSRVGITFTSGEGLTAFGRGLGIQSICAILISK